MKTHPLHRLGLIPRPPRASMLTTASLLVLFTLPGFAQQYKVIGADGKVTYTDRPPASAGDRVSPLKPHSVTSDPDAALPAELRQATQRYPVTLYVTENCPPCDAARQ
ncbi:MAG: DUF4124 domain-containing protein, partial [Burkholderiaceae bacterium]|nr:DUF4124 domain-containing protein [Burkholderiaceae bacterium]